MTPDTSADLRPSMTEPMPVSALAALAGPAAEIVAPADPAPAARPVTGVSLRAQQVRPGDLFAALPSLRHSGAHGADFADPALRAGAAAVLTDPTGARRLVDAGCAVPLLVVADPRAALGALASRIYGNPSARLRVVGVTGTSGKTTTAYLLEAGLRAAGLTTGLLGTVQARIAGEPLPSEFTTPEAPQLQALLALMLERGVTHLPMEVSSHGLALGRVDGTRFAVAGFTNLSQDHLDFHADMADYFAAKSLLFDGRATHEVVCVDDEWGRALAASRPDATTVSLDGAAAWRAEQLHREITGAQSFVAVAPDGARHRMAVRLPGAFNVTNAVLAMACGQAAGVDPALLASGIATAEVPGRMQRVRRGQDFLAVVDYAHKPAAVAALLDAVRAQVPGRVLVVLGCGGDRDAGKRPVMGAAAAERADLLVVTDDNPRSEDPAAIRRAMLDGALRAPDRGEVVEIGDRAEAIAHAVGHAGQGDAVVVAGKGHETGQEVAGVKHPFSDVTVLADALDRRVGR